MNLFGNLKSLFGSNSKVDLSARFELMREAISGTMSSFYMARDRRTREIVGLKILDIKKTAALEARFQGVKKPSEGEIASQFKHPRIVRTLEYGVSTQNEPFVVMEFLEGPGLNSLIVAKSPNLAGKRLNLLRQAAEALGVVHAAGYIHRDVCPRNFVVNPDCATLKLIDFGLTVPATAPFMQPGNRTGTANYMAPEVVRRKPTSKLLDVFAFGVTAYELFAFELPWPRGTSGLAAMSHGVDEPTNLRKYCPKIDPRLAAAITSCLAPLPEKRPGSMERFLEIIKAVKDEEA